MSPRQVQEPTRTKRVGRGGEVEVTETHPSFGLARFNHRNCSPGATLFDSEIRHARTVTFTISRAERTRGLNRDWLFGNKDILEIEMSEAQFGALVSSFGDGSGVPVTLRHTENEPSVPEAPYEPRMALSTAETKRAAVKAFESIRAAAEEVEKKPTKANIRTLMYRLDNAGPNVEFASKSLTEHVENVVTKARADIEGMVASHAATLGLTAADLPTFALEGPQGDAVDAEIVEES